MTYSYPKVTYSDPKVTHSDPTLGREEAPEHFFRRTAITSPDCQEFMV